MDYRELTDEEIVAIARKDSEVFGVLFERYERRLLYFIYPRLVKDIESAKDVVQEGICRAYFSLHSFNPNKKWSTWIHKIILNVAYSSIRRPVALPLEGFTGLQEEKEHGELFDRRSIQIKFRKAFDSLTGLEANVLQLFYHKGMSESQAARILKLSAPAVHACRIKAVQKIIIAAA